MDDLIVEWMNESINENNESRQRKQGHEMRSLNIRLSYSNAALYRTFHKENGKQASSVHPGAILKTLAHD